MDSEANTYKKIGGYKMFETNFIEEEEILLEEPENAEEQAAEEIVEGEEQATEKEIVPKTYTEEEVLQRVDELLPSKLEKGKARIRKELNREYEDVIALAEVVKAGLGVADVKEATTQLEAFYKEQGVELPAKREETYNENDLKILAEYEANEIIQAGYEDVVEETERLAAKGFENMTRKEKIMFQKLMEYSKGEKSRKELLEYGASKEVIESAEYKTFAKMFGSDTPAKLVYDTYVKANGLEKKPAEQIGSLKNGNTQDEKEYFTPEEVDKLTDEELSDPKTFNKVRRSMLKWKK